MFKQSLAFAVTALAMSSATATPFPAATAARGARDTINKYQDFSQKPKCAADICVLTFSAVNADVLIQHISCVFGVKTGSTAEFASLGTTGGQKGFNVFSPSKLYAVTGAEFYFSNAQAYFFVAGGQHPTITVASSKESVKDLQCTVSGQFTSDPA